MYGFAKQPTFPDAISRTDRLLKVLTKEVVLGRPGTRAIVGDYNHAISELQQTQVWRQLGWIEAQSLAEQWWDQHQVPTCKHSTFRDFVFLSPEAAAAVRQVQVTYDFQEHATVRVCLAFSPETLTSRRWPLPGEIPWDDVDKVAWQPSDVVAPPASLDSTKWYAAFAQGVERSLTGFMPDLPSQQLPRHCRGRAQRLQPLQHHSPATPISPSRQGEEEPAHGFLSLETKQWFKQLRRLQSLRQSVVANSPAAGAVTYRLELRRSIRQATGFRAGFPTWWLSRPIQLQGSPPSLTVQVPPAEVVELMFLDFRDNYRAFEKWQMQQHAKILASRFEQSMDELFRNLRDPRPEQVDQLVVNRVYEVLAVDSQLQQLHLSSPVDERGTSSWTFEGCPVAVKSLPSDSCEVIGDVDLSVPEPDLVQRQWLTSVVDIEAEFVSLWKPRWQKFSGCSLADWDRFLNFAEAFLHVRPPVIPSLTVEVWMAAARRYKPRAVKGSDGMARADLLHMHPQHVAMLVAFLQEVESGDRAWPEQLVEGFVCSLLKPGNKMGAEGYRPIVLFSLIYRTWSGIRARGLLQWLEGIMQHEACGFLPGHEAAELWYSLEAAVEVAVQGSEDLCGFSTDLVKCFNNIPRHPVFQLARRLGVPACILVPWQDFLDRVRRRFKIRDHVGEPILSTSGFAEGCPLSPAAMAFVDLMFHHYLAVFSFSVRSLSYVDNLAATAASVGSLAGGIASTQCFVDMLGLELDSSKTYVWAVTTKQRRELKALGLPVCSSARELGGIMSFGRSVRNKALVDRCHALAPIWRKLSRVKCSLRQKLSVLPARFWANALHGVSGAPLADGHLAQLRTQATKALRIGAAGVNPLLRLSVELPVAADPGYYEAWCTLADARRLCSKLPRVLQAWQDFMSGFHGDLFHGPFSKLMVICGRLNWRLLTPPCFEDEEGLQHDLLSMPVQLLSHILQRAWSSHVAGCVSDRKTMKGLSGIDQSLLSLDQGCLSALDLARVRALQSGAFWTSSSQCKFDLSKSPLCSVCHVPDTPEHRCLECSKFTCRADFGWVCSVWPSLPLCTSHHLLCPSNPHLPGLRAMMHALRDPCSGFVSRVVAPGRQNLFTDGACTQSGLAGVALAAFGVINASTEQIVACGHVAGIWQTAPRAELSAVLTALNWANAMQVAVTIWCDAKHVVTGLMRFWPAPLGDRQLPTMIYGIVFGRQ